MMLLAQAHEIIPIAVERTLDSLVGGLVLGAIAWTWLRVARRQNSASRFIILFILLIGIAALPIAGLSWVGSMRSVGLAEAHSLLTLPPHAADYLLALWSLVALFGLARIAIGFRQLHRLKSNCVEVDRSSLDARITSSLLESSRPVVLCTSDRVNVPTALGLASPAKIAIPEWLLSELSADELHHLVLHELAHLRRWDDWTNLAQKILGALFFFHPAMWWLQHRLSLEREMACDECVLAQTGNARGYAKSLANIAERSFLRRSIALAQAAVSRLHETTLRVTKILDSAAAGESRSKLPLVASAVAVSGITLVVALFSPDLVSFTAPKAPITVASAPATNAEPHLMGRPKATLASLHLSAGRPYKAVRAQASPETAAPTRETVLAQRKSTVAIAKAAGVNNAAAPPQAVLVYWQETYADGSGMVVQRTTWRVVLLNTPIPKEQPHKI